MPLRRSVSIDYPNSGELREFSPADFARPSAHALRVEVNSPNPFFFPTLFSSICYSGELAGELATPGEFLTPLDTFLSSLWDSSGNEEKHRTAPRCFFYSFGENERKAKG